MLLKQRKIILILKILLFTFEETLLRYKIKRYFGSKLFYDIESKNIIELYSIFIGNMPHF
jgi:hypothetical protein